MLLEPDLQQVTVCRKRGVQVADSVVMPSADENARVMITNCLGMSQRGYGSWDSHSHGGDRLLQTQFCITSS